MGKIMFEMESVVNRSAPSEIPDSEVSKMLEDLNECSEQQKLLVPSRVEVSKNVSQWSQVRTVAKVASLSISTILSTHLYINSKGLLRSHVAC